MKVVEIISDQNIGGAGVLLCTRLKYTDRKEFQTTVILPEGSQLKSRIESLNYSVREVRGAEDRSWSWVGLWSHMCALKELNPDLVNCHASLSGRVAATLCGVPAVIYTRHCVFPLKPWQRTSLGKMAMRIGQGLFLDQAIAVAHAAKENLISLGVSPRRIHVIVNGVEGKRALNEKEKDEIKRSLGYGDEHFVVGICGRLEACKGHLELLHAAAILIQRNQNFRFLIIGDGSQRAYLENVCKKKGLTPYVTFTGFAEDVTPYLNVLDLQVNCSRGSETSSLALSEGMSLGLPTVASDFGGNPYMIRDGENGYLYPVGNPRALVQKIWEIYSDPQLRHSMGDRAYRRFLEELNARCMTRKTHRLYRSMMRGAYASIFSLNARMERERS